MALKEEYASMDEVPEALKEHYGEIEEDGKKVYRPVMEGHEKGWVVTNVQALEEHKTKLLGETKTAKEKSTTAEAELQAAKDRVAELEKGLPEKDETIKSKDTELGTLQAQIASLTTEKAASDTEKATFETERTTLQTQASALQKQNAIISAATRHFLPEDYKDGPISPIEFLTAAVDRHTKEFDNDDGGKDIGIIDQFGNRRYFTPADSNKPVPMTLDQFVSELMAHKSMQHLIPSPTNGSDNEPKKGSNARPPSTERDPSKFMKSIKSQS